MSLREYLQSNPKLARELARYMDVVEGNVQGLRTALRIVLEARSLRITDSAWARIDREDRSIELEAWIEAAATAETLADVFRDR